MNKFFEINFEFDRHKFEKEFEELIFKNSSSYVCVVDANVLTFSSLNLKYKEILNASNLNSCDGSFITFLLRIIYKKRFSTYTGPEIFNDYISLSYRHLLLGNTPEVYSEVVRVAVDRGSSIDNFTHLDIPFANVEDFNYVEIANKINEINPQIIWVSLGAPKQEEFMNKLQPFLNRGVMVGIGAAFSFYIGLFQISNINMFSLNFTWFYRLLSEPQKQIKRLFLILIKAPKLFIMEYYRSSNVINK